MSNCESTISEIAASALCESVVKPTPPPGAELVDDLRRSLLAEEPTGSPTSARGRLLLLLLWMLGLHMMLKRTLLETTVVTKLTIERLGILVLLHMIVHGAL